MLSENIEIVQTKINNALAMRKEAKKTGETVTLVAVTKNHPAEVILASMALGISDIGENRVQEAKQKNLDSFLGQKYNPKDKSTVKFDPNYNSVYLKIKGDEIFTSNSIRVPLKESLALYRRYLDGKNILGISLNHYSVVKSSKESVTIGCTTISAFELNRVLGNLV